MKTGVLSEPVMVGREKELEDLQRCLDDAIEGKGGTVFVSGEAGSGKTRLVHEFLSDVEKKNVQVLAGWCLSDVTVPYFPFMEAFRSRFSARHKRENEDLRKTQMVARPEPPDIDGFGLTTWLSWLSQSGKMGSFATPSPHVWKDQLFAAVAGMLHSMATLQPVVLLIEDVHWADSASLALLHYISRVTLSERVLVLATFRNEELTSDAEGRPHPLTETQRAMGRENLFTEIRLSNLDSAETSRMAENMIGGSLQPEFAKKLAKESRGNPLFVVESLRMLYERKSLVAENNKWRLAVDELGIPPKVRDIILRRLAILKYSQRRVLDAASVIGEKFDVELLSAVVGQDVLEVLEALNVIAHSTSLVSVEKNFYRFDHARSRETLYEELASPLRKGYHGKIAEKLENLSKNGAGTPVGDLAYHYVEAGNTAKAIYYSIAAGKDALEKFSNAEAIKHFTYVLQIITGTPESASVKEIALEGLGDAFYANSMFKESMRKFEELSETAETEFVKLRALRKAMESAFQQGETSHLIELVNKAEQYTKADRLESARVLVSRGRTFVARALVDPAMVLAANEDYSLALKVFEEEYSLWDAAWALMGIGGTNAVRGRSGLAESLRSIALFEEVGDFHWQMEAYYVAGWTFNQCLLEHEALNMFAKIIEIDDKMKMGDYLRLVFANAFSSHSFEQLGDFEKALSYGLKALELSKKTESLVARGLALSVLVVHYTMLEETEHAQVYFDKLMELPQEVLLHPYLRVPYTEAVFYAGKSKWEISRTRFRELLSVPSSVGRLALYKSSFAHFLEMQGHHEEAKTQLEDGERIRRESKERFEHTNVQANLMVRRQTLVGEEFEMRFDLVNVSRKPGMLTRIEGAVLSEFKIVDITSFSTVQNDSIEMSGRVINPFQVVTVKLKLKATKANDYRIGPKVVYIDDLGESKTIQLDQSVIVVQQPKRTFEILPDRITTGYIELDALLFGGIPEMFAVVLASPSNDERELLIRRFLEAGAGANEITFHLAVEATNGKTLAERYPTSFNLFVCNPQADSMIQNLPNVHKLKGVDNLTEIDIALTKAFRALDPSVTGPRRICIEIISDVLLQHHAVITRKWLGALLPTLKSKNFTVLAVIDPNMHPSEEVQAVFSVFDGEIRVTEKDTPQGAKKTLAIRRMHNQKFMESELILSREKLTQ